MLERGFNGNPEWERRRAHPFTPRAKKILDDQDKSIHKKNLDLILEDEQQRLTEMIKLSTKENFRLAISNLAWDSSYGYSPEDALRDFENKFGQQFGDAGGRKESKLSFGDLIEPMKFENESKLTWAEKNQMTVEAMEQIDTKRFNSPGFDAPAFQRWKMATFTGGLPPLPRFDDDGNRIFTESEDEKKDMTAQQAKYSRKAKKLQTLLRKRQKELGVVNSENDEAGNGQDKGSSDPSEDELAGRPVSDDMDEAEALLELPDEEFRDKGYPMIKRWIRRLEHNLQVYETREMRQKVKEAEWERQNQPELLEQDPNLPHNFIKSLPAAHFNRLYEWARASKQPNSVLDMAPEELTDEDLNFEHHDHDYQPLIVEQLHPNDPMLSKGKPALEQGEDGRVRWALTGELYDQSKMNEFHLHNMNHDTVQAELMTKKIREGKQPSSTTALDQFGQNVANLQQAKNGTEQDAVIILGPGPDTAITSSTTTSPIQPGEFDHLNPQNTYMNDQGEIISTITGKPFSIIGPNSPKAKYVTFKLPRQRTQEEKDQYVLQKRLTKWLEREAQFLPSTQQYELSNWYKDYIDVTVPYKTHDLPLERMWMTPTEADTLRIEMEMGLQRSLYERNATLAEKHRELDLQQMKEEQHKAEMEQNLGHNGENRRSHFMEQNPSANNKNNAPFPPLKYDPKTQSHMIGSAWENFNYIQPTDHGRNDTNNNKSKRSKKNKKNQEQQEEDSPHLNPNLSVFQQFITTPLHLIPTSRILEPTREEIVHQESRWGTLAENGLDDPTYNPQQVGRVEMEEAWVQDLTPAQRKLYDEFILMTNKARVDIKHRSEERRALRAMEKANAMTVNAEDRLKKKRKDEKRRRRRDAKIRSGSYDPDNDPDFIPTEPSEDIYDNKDLISDTSSEELLGPDNEMKIAVKEYFRHDLQRRRTLKDLREEPYSGSEIDYSEDERRRSVKGIGYQLPPASDTELEEPELDNRGNLTPEGYFTQLAIAERERLPDGRLKPEWEHYYAEKARLENQTNFRRFEELRRQNGGILPPGTTFDPNIKHTSTSPKIFPPHKAPPPLVDQDGNPLFDHFFDPKKSTKIPRYIPDDILNDPKPILASEALAREPYLDRLKNMIDEDRRQATAEGQPFRPLTDYLPSLFPPHLTNTLNKHAQLLSKMDQKALVHALNENNLLKIERFKQVRKIAERDLFSRFTTDLQQLEWLNLPAEQREQLIDNFTMERQNYNEQQMERLTNEYRQLLETQRSGDGRTKGLDQVRIKQLAREMGMVQRRQARGDYSDDENEGGADGGNDGDGDEEDNSGDDDDDDDDDNNNNNIPLQNDPQYKDGLNLLNYRLGRQYEREGLLDQEAMEDQGQASHLIEDSSASPPNKSNNNPDPDPSQPIILGGPPPTPSSPPQSSSSAYTPSFTMMPNPPEAPESTQPAFKATWRPAPKKNQV